MSHPYDDEDIRNLVDQNTRYDPLDALERKVSMHWSDEGFPQELALVSHLVAVQARNSALLLAEDSRLSMEIAEYIPIIAKEGFQQVYEADFRGSEGRKERLLVFWQSEKGILLKFDTFNGVSLNSGKFYYNWKPTVEHWLKYTSSGSFNADGIWCGDHDCREGVRFHIRQLADHGDFITPWVRQPFLWLRGYKENDEDQARHLASLPGEVRSAILLGV